MNRFSKHENTTTDAPEKPLDFIRQIVAEDLKSGKHSNIVTRFPPEPNGFQLRLDDTSIG